MGRHVDGRVLPRMSEPCSSVGYVVGLKFDMRDFEVRILYFRLHDASEVFSILGVHVIFLSVEDVIVERSFLDYAFHSFSGDWKFDLFAKDFREV